MFCLPTEWKKKNTYGATKTMKIEIIIRNGVCRDAAKADFFFFFLWSESICLYFWISISFRFCCISLRFFCVAFFFSLVRVVYCFGHTFAKWIAINFIDSLQTVQKIERKKNEELFLFDCVCVCIYCRRILGDEYLLWENQLWFCLVDFSQCLK